MTQPSIRTALCSLMTAFNELNSNIVEELDSEPSPLEFMRFVARNTPFVVRGGASHWKATQKWNPTYLKSILEGQTVNVAVTPSGNADAPTFSVEHDITVLAKPYEEEQLFKDFLTYIIKQEDSVDLAVDSEVRYAQTQNDNLHGEYSTLLPDVQADIPFARIALQKSPEAINLWIGNSKSTTALHKDNFENIFVQIAGRKHFLLISPLFHACVNEQLMPPATYIRQRAGFALRLDSNCAPVPLATWDPETPQENLTELSHLAKPLNVTLNPGDMLYLPAMWYHKVSQSCIKDGEGFVAAVNYWYDMDFSGPLFPVASFLRNIDFEGQSPP